MNQRVPGGPPPRDQAWFSGAPTSKVLLLCSIITHAYVHNKKNGPSLQFDSLQMHGGSNLHRYATSKMFFLSSGELIVGIAFLFRFLRKYEREMGTRKFLCFWFVQCSLGIAQELVWLQALNTRNLVLDPTTPMRWSYAGPYALVGSLFLLFHTYAPRVHPRVMSILGFHFSEKSFYYIWFCYFAAAGGWNTLVPTSTGLVSSMIYMNTPFLSNMIVPSSVVRVFRPLLERFGLTQDQPQPRVPAPRHAPPQQQRRPEQPRPEAPPASTIPLPDPDPEAIEQLTGMGFGRPQVMEALRQSHNNVDHAVHRLLAGT